MSEDFYCDVMVPKRHVPSPVDLGGATETLLHAVLAVVRTVAGSRTAGRAMQYTPAP